MTDLNGLKLDDLRVNAPFALHGELSSLNDFDHWRLDAGGDYYCFVKSYLSFNL